MLKLKRAILIGLCAVLIGAFFVLPSLPAAATDPIYHDFDAATQFPMWLTGTTTIMNYPGWFLGTPSASGQALLVTGTNNTIGTGLGMATGLEFNLSQNVYITTVTAWVYNSQANFTTFQFVELDGAGNVIDVLSATGGGTGSRTITIGRNVSNRFVIQVHKSGFGGTTTIGFDDLQINVDFSLSASPTPGPTLTPSPTFAATFPPAIGYPSCLIIPDSAARFTSLNAWNLTIATPHPSGGLNFPLGSKIELKQPLSLDPAKQYQVVLGYRTNQTQPDEPLGQALQFRLGGEAAMPIPLFSSEDDGKRTATIGALNYPPAEGGGHPFYVEFPGLYVPVDIELKLDYVCIRDATTVGGGIGGQPGETEIRPCRTCEFERVGDIWLISDLLGVIAWLLCQLVRFWECIIVPLMQGTWNFIGSILLAIVSFFKWALDTTFALIGWIGGILLAIVRWSSGLIFNAAVNAVNFLNDIGVLDFLNRIVSFVRDIPTAIGNLLSGLGQFIVRVVEIGVAIFTLILLLIGYVVNAVITVIGVIPVIISSLFTGFNDASPANVSGMIVCAQQSGLLIYIPCLGFYILDNTIFQGPAFWLLPLLIGVVALDTILWAAQEIKKNFSKG